MGVVVRDAAPLGATTKVLDRPLALPFVLIHSSSWKGYSRNFRFTEFYEVDPDVARYDTRGHCPVHSWTRMLSSLANS